MIHYSSRFYLHRSLDGLEWWLTLLNLVKNLKKEEGNISYKLIIPDEMSLYGFYTKNKYVLSITDIATLINLYRVKKFLIKMILLFLFE